MQNNARTDIAAPELEGYRLEMELAHDNISEFIVPWLQKKNFYIRFYKAALFFGFMLIGGVAGYYISAGILSFWSVILHFFAGVLLTFFLIPLHEWLHGIAYKLAGAKQVQYKANWRKFVFYALANRFPTDYTTFRLVALMPFSVITLIFVGLVFLAPAHWHILLLSIAVSHASFCIGDFVLLAYMNMHKEQGMITMDVNEQRKTFFYVRT